ncbi:bis(5'-nucleosyl)-tetraphosphatase (symmetrical) YqeK [Holzapfeliella sp. He02]|uniref:bis(5'-nucleosyl)-tetraphosphatase (symmetrical) n=1 Tax=Holzapfeliella saturejae TaxID=3082953 RepID=A0ABU8SHC4_9LACO
MNLKFSETYSDLSSDEIIAKAKQKLSTGRFEHCVRVSQTARELAKQYGVDENEAALAGFVHDYAKEVPVDTYIETIKTQKFDQDLLNYNRGIWHGIVGAYYIEQELKIKNPAILTAVKRHTTADTQMTDLDKIVFMADYIEPGRHFPGVEEARKQTHQSLDQGVAYQLQQTLIYLIKNNFKVYPKTLASYNVWNVK